MVEVDGYRSLVASCIFEPRPGLVVRTDTPRATAARRSVMELLLAEATIEPDSEAGRGIDVSLAACICCNRCVQACNELEVNNVIGVSGRGPRCKIVFDLDDPLGRSSCVGCGACVQACPSGALTFRMEQ
jgi:formate dehydrogenase major subunit